ncbi:MAG: alpha/beta hydrolase [Massiliimalia sp.]|jgi:acetyl esterase/lipase
MIHQVIDLNLDYKAMNADNGGYKPKLYTYVLDNFPEINADRVRPAVVICPGGGYEFTSDREAEAVAIQLNARGYQAFILRYSVAPARFPAALLELAYCVSLVKAHAKEWHVDPDRVFISGFSAGGHLACTLGCFWNQERVWKPLGLSPEQVRPAGMILNYPVITSNEFAHRGSFRALLGDQEEKLADSLSMEKQVSGDTVPVFLWHTYTDDAVPVENSLMFAMALREHHIPLEMHIYPYGPHGLGLANRETHNREGGNILPHCQGWIDLAANWIRDFDQVLKG